MPPKLLQGVRAKNVQTNEPKEKRPPENLFEKAKRSAIANLERSIASAKVRWIDHNYPTPEKPKLVKLKGGKERVLINSQNDRNWRLSPVYVTDEKTGHPLTVKLVNPETGKPHKDPETGKQIEVNMPKTDNVGEESVYVCISVNGQKYPCLEAQDSRGNIKTDQEQIMLKGHQVVPQLEIFLDWVRNMEQDDDDGKHMVAWLKSIDKRPQKIGIYTHKNYVWSDTYHNYVEKGGDWDH